MKNKFVGNWIMELKLFKNQKYTYSIFIEVCILIFHFGLFLDSFFRFVFEIERSGKIKIFFKYFWK